MRDDMPQPKPKPVYLYDNDDNSVELNFKWGWIVGVASTLAVEMFGYAMYLISVSPH